MKTLWLALGLALCPVSAGHAEPRLRDRDFKNRLKPGPRPLFYLAHGMYWPGRGLLNPCHPLVGGDYHTPTFVLYADGTVFYVPPLPQKTKRAARVHRVKLTRKERAALVKKIRAAGLSGMRDFYDLVPGAHHSRNNVLISWLSGRRRSVYVRGGGGLHLPAYVSARKQRFADKLPAPLIQLQLDLSSYTHPRGRPWSPPFELELYDVTAWKQSKARSIPWPAGWSKPKLSKSNPSAKIQLPGAQLKKGIALLGVLDGCFNPGKVHLELAGRRYSLRLILPALPQGHLWRRRHSEIAELVLLLRDPDRLVRARALNSLELAAGEGVTPLLRMLHHRSPRVRALTAMTLGEVVSSRAGYDKKWVPIKTQVAGPLARLLVDGAELARIHAAVALWKLGRRTAKVMAVMVKGLRSPVAPLRQFTAGSLEKFAPKVKGATAQLERALADPDLEVRVLAAFALHKQNGSAKATPVLSAGLAKAPDRLRDRIVKRLGEIARRDKKVWSVVIKALGDRYYHARGEAVKALAGSLRHARRAVKPLLNILTLDTGYVRDDARKLLLRLKVDKRLVATLIMALKSKDHDVRYWTTNDLETLGKRARAAVPALINMLKTDPYHPARASAATALGAIDGKNKKVLRALRGAAARSPGEAVRSMAREALKKLGH